MVLTPWATAGNHGGSRRGGGQRPGPGTRPPRRTEAPRRRCREELTGQADPRFGGKGPWQEEVQHLSRQEPAKSSTGPRGGWSATLAGSRIEHSAQLQAHRRQLWGVLSPRCRTLTLDVVQAGFGAGAGDEAPARRGANPRKTQRRAGSMPATGLGCRASRKLR